MFKRFVTIMTVIAILTLFPNAMARANAFNTSTDSKPTKKKRPSCASCTAAQDNSSLDSIEKVATLGRRTQPQPLTPLQRSIFEGTSVNLVSTSTGHLAFSVTDLEIPGSMPLIFQRTYSSDRTEDTGLGTGWSFVFDDRITLNDETATLSTATGMLTTFRRDGQTQRYTLQTDEPTSHQSFEIADPSTIIEASPGWTRTYKKIGSSYRLKQIADNNGNTITINFNGQGNVHQIVSSSGGVLTLEWSDDIKDARLLTVTDNVKRQVSFKQNGHRLRAITDPAGVEWKYAYQDSHLTRATDPLNRVLLRARYDKEGRVVETGDAVGICLFGYDFTLDGVSRQTVLTDPLGAKTFFEHTPRGALATISDDEGQALLRIEYNAANRPVRLFDSKGNENLFTYDSQNRLLRQSTNGNVERAYTYDAKGRISSFSEGTIRTDYVFDAQGNIIKARSTNPAKNYSVTYTERSQIKSISSESGRIVSFEYDAHGNKTALAYSGIGRFETEYDAAGRKLSEHLPSGRTFNYEYDARGFIVKESDNKGRAVKAERDASGALIALVSANGAWVRAVRDEAGRITQIMASNGKSRRFAYDARGALTDYTNARGKRRKFKYDRRGRLENVTDDDGLSFNYVYDRHGKLLTIKRKGKQNSLSIMRLGHRHSSTSASLTLSPLQGEDYAPWCFDGSDGLTSDLDWSGQVSFGFGDWQDFGNSCASDPFGGFGSDVSYIGSSEEVSGSLLGNKTCLECIKRRIEACDAELKACLLRYALPGGATAAAACAALVGSGVITALGAPLAALLCGSIIGISISVGCFFDALACSLRAPDECPSCK